MPGMHPHGVDYARTSERLTWHEVPADAVRALEDRLGSAVVAAAPPVGSGFGGQYAGRLHLSDGREVFAKAAPERLEFPAASLRREGVVLPLLSEEVPAPRLLAVVEANGWVLLALEHLVGRMPGQPWTPDDLWAAYDACVAVAAAPAPTEAAGGQFRDAVRRDDRLLSVEGELAAGRFALPTTYGHDDWLSATARSHGRQIAELSRAAAELLEGDALCHNDLRPDNVVVTDAGAVLVDWNYVTLAPAWLDFVCLLPMAHRQGLGLDPWWHSDLVAASATEQVDALLAVLGVYFLSTQALPPPPGCTSAARRHQLVYAHDFIGLLAHRRGWPAP